MVHGFWKQSEFNSYSFHDLVQINSVIAVLEENKRRATEAAIRAREEGKRNR